MLKAGRTFVPNFQHRVLIGTATFVGMLLLVGWVAVNEPARMEVFTDQYHGRSIENGATTFLNACSTCHGVDGKGSGQAPALNNPMLFLKDNPAKLGSAKADDLKQQIASAQNEIVTYNKNVAAFEQANAALQKDPNDAQLKTQVTSLTSQITSFDLAKTQQQIDDLTRQYNQAQGDLALLQQQGWDPNRETRLTEVKWTGTLHDYIFSTVSSGRPVSALYWPGAMPTWAQANGGPLRPDEVEDVTQYVMNFQDTAIKLTPKDVKQQFKVPVEGTGGPAVKINASGKVVGDADTKALRSEGWASQIHRPGLRRLSPSGHDWANHRRDNDSHHQFASER